MSVEEKVLNTNIDKDGNIAISNDVIATIAAIAAKSIDGVYGMVNSLTGGFAELLGKKNPSKGVKVTVNDRDVKIDMFVVVEYGVKIPDVAWEIQGKTKNEVEAMTGLNVTAVNVNIEGVNTVAAEPETVAEPVEEIDEEATTEE
ncbi:MAG: Asp23/Gls24 family envelope stress response protein [Ruminococcaceae bacterium]|nr:Asp23/Gls24 family envelope stress response protein [Oscillospiraceae bacterium]